MVNLFFILTYLPLSLLLDYFRHFFDILCVSSVGYWCQKVPKDTWKERKFFTFKYNILIKSMETHLKSLFIQTIKEVLNARENIKLADIFRFHSWSLCDSLCVIALVSWTRESKEGRVSITVVSHLEAHRITVCLLYTGFPIQSET